jgi:aryl-alcohol dehydrogenase-like predicted oxidoreductase
MQQRTIGGVRVGAVGLGAMPFSVASRDPEEARSVRTLHAALDSGVSLVDTADAYTLDPADPGHNERVVARALAAYGGDASHVLVATKGGHTRLPDGGWGVNGRPDYIRQACERSLKALGVEAIGLYQYHRPDPEVPYAETVGTFRELRDEGKVRMVGISNANPEQIRLASEVMDGDLASVQNEFSPRFRSSEPEIGVCQELGVAFLPWSPLGGTREAGEMGSRHGAFAEVAAGRGVTPQVVALAWMLAKAGNVVPIPGASRPGSIEDSASAADLTLTAEELALLG